MTAPSRPTEDEVRRGEFRWEYEQQSVDVASMGDPPGSRRPIVTIRRRMVSAWETYDDEVEPGEET